MVLQILLQECSDSRTYILGNLMETGAYMHGFIAAVSRRARTVSKARDLITKKATTMK